MRRPSRRLILAGAGLAGQPDGPLKDALKELGRSLLRKG